MSEAVARRLTYAVSLLLGLLAWQVAAAQTSRVILVPFPETVVDLWDMAVAGTLWDALSSTLIVFGTGTGIAVVTGYALGLALARKRLLRIGLDDYLTMLYATPMVAIIPFVLSVLGFGFWPKVIVVFLFAVFPVIINTTEGARSIKPELIEVARSFRSTEPQLWRDVIIPYTLPYTMTGVRQAIARGFVGAIAAEFFLSSSGLGQQLIINARLFDTGKVLGLTLVVTLLGVVLMAIGRSLEKRFAAWRGGAT
jgi:ABC-type nitrate/sulfonate/bicarbonate transport system permease component